MSINKLLGIAAFSPGSLNPPNSWVGHLPFAAWVIQTISPKIFVELGTHTGNSYFAFCQSVAEAGVKSKCYAVDTWQGDEHAGQYNDEIFSRVNLYNEEHYAQFSQLLQMTFDKALSNFADGSIDLLHIDGLHTYEAVRHDFETWLPKLAPGAVVLFHDTNVREHNFGVWQLWEELQSIYPNNMEFMHSHGLGVLQLNNFTEDKKLQWLESGSLEKKILINYFAALGSRQLEHFELKNLKQILTERDNWIAVSKQILAERDKLIAIFKQGVSDHDGQLAFLQQQITNLHNSSSWRITAPLRFTLRQIKRIPRIIKLALPAIKLGGGLGNTVIKAANLYRREGILGIKRGFRMAALSATNLTVTPVIATRPVVAERSDRFGYIEHDPLISILGVNFNGAVHLPEFLESLGKQSYRNFEIIIVDNGSSDNSVAIINQYQINYPGVIRLIKAGKNLGFAEGNNVAQDNAKGEFVALLNIDTRVHEDWLRESIEAIRTDGSAAAVASKILFWTRFKDIEICSQGKIVFNLKAMANSLTYKKYFVRTGSAIDADRVESNADGMIVISIPVQEEALQLELSNFNNHEVSCVIRSGNKILARASFVEKIILTVDYSLDSLGNAGFLVNNAGSIAGAEDMPLDRGFAEYDQGQFEKKCYLPYFCGCAVLIRRAAIIDRTIFVPDFFAYYEDAELSRWLTTSGFKIIYAPRALVFHRHSATSSEGSSNWQYLVERSRLIFKYTGAVEMLERDLLLVRSKFLKLINPELMDILTNYDNNLIQRLSSGVHIVKPLKATVIHNCHWNTRGGGESHVLSIASELQRYGWVELISNTDFDIESLSKFFSIDLSRCRKLILPIINTKLTLNFHVFINSSYGSNLISKALHSFYIVYFPHRDAPKELFESYYFMYCSEYIRKWTERYWGENLNGDIFYPIRMLSGNAVNENSTFMRNKKKIILSVGRFNPSGHCKNQLEIAKAYRALVKAVPTANEWRLVLAGGLDFSNLDCISYFDEVKSCLSGLNAEVFANVEKVRLEQFFSDAMIYVHAAGIGRDKDYEPEKFEHFGITPVEAMLAGCVPLVFDTGGPADLIHNLDVGYTFSSFESLSDSLKKLIMCDFESLLKEGNVAKDRAGNFVRSEFNKPMFKEVYVESLTAKQAVNVEYKKNDTD